MTQKQQIQLFGEKKVRSVWDSEQEKWYFSIVDVCHFLTDQPDYDHAKNYWKVLKFRLVKEGNESVTNCNQLKLVSPKEVIYTRGDPPLTFNLKTLTQNLPLCQILPIFAPRNVNFRRFYISGFRNNL